MCEHKWWWVPRLPVGKHCKEGGHGPPAPRTTANGDGVGLADAVRVDRGRGRPTPKWTDQNVSPGFQIGAKGKIQQSGQLQRVEEAILQ